MDLTFQEKSAWGLLVGIVLVSCFYFPAAFRIAAVVPHAAPLIAISVIGVIAIVVIETIYHIIIAIPAGDAPLDERDKLIGLKAERNSAYVLGVGLFTLVGWIVMQSVMPVGAALSPLTIAVCILLALTVSEVAKLAWQLWYYRTGV